MAMPLVSVIVPIYKVEKYLENCIKSVQSQSFSNWELILVDDGSPDESGKICDIFSQEDARICTIHQKNQGVSAARKNGLNESHGKWVFFLDADDMLPIDSLATLVYFSENNDLDICIGNHIKLSSPKTHQIIKNRNKIIIVNGQKYLENVANCKYMMALWGKLYKRTLLTNSNIFIERRITNNEDYLYNLFLAPNVKRTGIISKPIYIYNDIREMRASYNKCDCYYWKMFLRYMKEESLQYNVPSEYILKARIQKLCTLLRCEPTFELNLLGDDISDITQLTNYKGMSFWQVATIFTCKHPSCFFRSLMRFHPTRIVHAVSKFMSAK